MLLIRIWGHFLSEQAKIAYLEQEIKRAGTNRNAFIIGGVASILLCFAFAFAIVTQMPPYQNYDGLIVLALVVAGTVSLLACLSASSDYSGKRKRLMNELSTVGTVKPSRNEQISMPIETPTRNVDNER